MEKIRVGIIGMGKMGLLHSAILNSLDHSKVVAFADTEKMVTNLLRDVSDASVYNDYKKMIENEKIDVVYITTPVKSHIPIATFCAQNNIHFFVEKHLGITIGECKMLCDVINENRVFSMIGYYLRYAETFSKVKQLLEENTLGEIKEVNSSVFQSQSLSKPSGWRFNKKISGGGVLIDLGSHLIDLLSWYFGKIKSVQGKTESHYNQEVEDTAQATLKFENGLNCKFDASWNVENYRLQETTIEIKGIQKMITVNEDFYKITDYKTPENSTITYRQEMYTGVPIDIGGPEYTREDNDFINCIRNKKQPMLNVFSAMQTQNVIDSIYKASLSNNTVEIEN